MLKLYDWIRRRTFFSEVLGISREEQDLKIAFVTKENSQVRLSQCMTIPLENKEAFLSVLAAQKKIATGLESHEVVFRSISLPLKNARKVLDALPFQLETLLPFPIEQAIVCPFLKSQDLQCTSVTFIATSKDLLKKHLTECIALDFHPDVVTCAPLALFRLSRWLYPEQKDLLFFHFGDHKTHCIAIQEGRLQLSQTIRVGKSEWKEALASSTLHSFKERLSNELERLAIFIKEKIHLVENTPWALAGEPSSCKECHALWKQFFADAELPIAEHSVHTHALSIGFALDALSNDAQRMQFLQKEFLPLHHLKVRKKRGLLYAAACVALSAIIGLSSTIALKKKTNALSDKLLSHFPSAQNKKSLTLSEMEEVLSKSEHALLKAKTGFPFFLTIPKVSEVLAWLSTHPAFSSADGLPKEGIEIKSFRYQLIKFPTLEEPAAPYQATIDLEFTATTPRLAREFHDALLKGDRIVNAKKELKWNTQGVNYSVQFELNKSANL